MKISGTIPVHQLCLAKNSPLQCIQDERDNHHPENEEIAARLDEGVRKGHRMEFKARRKQLAAVWFSVEEIYNQTPGFETAGKRIG